QPQWDPWKPQSQQPWNSGGSGQSPDWAALADASEARHKRRRLLFIGSGALATVAIGTAVAVAVVSANGDNRTAGGPSSQLPGAAGSGAALAVAVVSASADPRTAGGPSSQLPGAATIPSAEATVPSFAPTSAPPPLDPADFIASAKKDRAPLAPDVLFPGTQL